MVDEKLPARIPERPYSGLPATTAPGAADVGVDLRAILTEIFDGHEIAAFAYRGRPVVIANQLGEILGYGNEGRKLPKMLAAGTWGYRDGDHGFLLAGGDLADAKALRLGTSAVPSHAPSLMVLTEEGVHLVLLNTGKPECDRIRVLLARVMPALVRGEGVPPSSNPRMPKAKGLTEYQIRSLELRAMVQHRLQVAEQCRKIKALGEIAERSGAGAKSVAVWEMRSISEITGIDVTPLLPTEVEEWMTVTQMAERRGNATAQRIGLTITHLGLRDPSREDLCRAVRDMARQGDRVAPKEVVSYQYTVKAYALICAYLDGQKSEPPPGSNGASKFREGEGA